MILMEIYRQLQLHFRFSKGGAWVTCMITILFNISIILISFLQYIILYISCNKNQNEYFQYYLDLGEHNHKYAKCKTLRFI